MVSTLSRTLLSLATAALLLAGCGDDSVESGDSDMAEDMDMSGDSAIEGAESEHEHDEAADAIPWDGETTPTVEVSVAGDPDAGWDIAATVGGFSFSDPSAIDHVAGWGHTHVFVDGLLVSMSYEPVVHVDDLDPGPHQATVTLSRNDHADYSLGGELITATTSFTVAGEVDPADASFTVMYMDGVVSGVDGRVEVATGDVVELSVESDVNERVHVHGYDRFVEVGEGETATLRFTALIAGTFEIELEETSTLLFEMQVR